MDSTLPLTCPTCGEEFTIPFAAADEGSSVFVVDCEICCRPLTVQVRVQDGEAEVQAITAE